MAPGLPEGTVTILFTDVVGSTELRTGRGDASAHQVLQAHFDLVRREIERHSGQEVKTIGDSFMVAFGSARRALECAIAVQRALEEHRRQHPEQAVHLRIGLNSGEVIEEQEDLFGAAVDAAARVMTKADGGQILVSETVRGLVGAAKEFEFIDRGRFRLKGFPERWRLYEVVWQVHPAPSPTLPQLVERTPFVGREAERAELRRLLDQALAGQGTVAMIGGEPGVGKTRLAEELATEARERGVLTLVGHCYEMEGAPPYIPFVEILEAAARTVSLEALRNALGDAAPEVAKLLPELRRLFPDLPPPLELPADQERHFLFNSVREFVTRASGAQPLLFVLDDLHWAEDSTLLLIQHLAQYLQQMPVLIIGTYRDVELDVARPLATTLENLLRQRLAHRISLRRLPQADVAAMLRAVSGKAPPAAFVDAVYRETEGNPFFVEEVFQHLAEEGKLFDPSGKDWRSDLEVSELDVPEGVRLVIGRRLQRVSEESRRALAAAAVIGRVFGYELLEALGDPSAGSGQGVDADALLDAVDEAERAQLIVSTSEGREARFTFAHELIRQTLASNLSLPRRQRIHLQIAEAMERVYARSLEEHAADLAHHYYQAGAAADLTKTVHYLALAAERALAGVAFEDALRHCEIALSLETGEDRLTYAGLLFKRGLARRSLGRWEEALADWREALDTFEELKEAEAVGRVAFHLAEQLGWNARWEEGVETARRGLAALGDRVSADRCHLLNVAGSWLALSGQDYRGGAVMLDQALAMAEELGDQHLQGLALQGKASVRMWHMQPGPAVEAGLRSAELVRAAGDLWNLADGLWITQYALLNLGRLDEAARMAEEAEPLAIRLGHLGALMAVRRGSAARELMLTADIDRYEEFARADLDLCRTAGMPWVSNSYAYLGLAHFWRGRWQEALQSFQEGARLEPPGILAGYDWGDLFYGRAYAGDKEAALSMLDERRDGLPRPGRANTFGAWAMLLAAVEGLAVLDEREEAAKLYPLTLEALNTGAVVHWWFGPVETYAGIAAACGGRWEEAEAHYQQALRLAHELPVVIAQPEVRRWYARMLIDRDGPGDREKARQLLDEAIAMYHQIGMPKHVEMAAAMLAEL